MTTKPTPTADQIADLKAKHEEVWTLGSSVVDIVVRMPTMDQFNAFTLQVMDERQKPRAAANLLHSCIVWPTGQEYMAAIAKRPGVAVKLQAQFAQLTGLDDEIRVEKA
jgi:hypothetical protein